MLEKQLKGEVTSTTSRKKSFLRYKTIELNLKSPCNITTPRKPNNGLLCTQQLLERKEKVDFTGKRILMNNRFSLPQKQKQKPNLILSKKNRRWLRGYAGDPRELIKTPQDNHHITKIEPNTISPKFLLKDLHIRGGNCDRYFPFVKENLKFEKEKQNKTVGITATHNEVPIQQKQQSSTQKGSCAVQDDVNAERNYENNYNGRYVELIQEALVRNSIRKCELWLSKYF